MTIHNSRHDDKQNDFPWVSISFVILIAFTLAYHNEIWEFMAWVMDTTDNFHASR